MFIMARNKKQFIEVGEKHGRLTVVKFSHQDKRWRKFYICKCDCGKEKAVMGSAFTSGSTKSCGCYGKEIRKSKLFADNRGVINQIILQYKRHAKSREYLWNLSYEIVKNIIQQPCYYCGTKKSNLKITKNCIDGYGYNGIDRINNDIGYEPENVVACCKICNYAKSDMSAKDFIFWVQRTAKHTKAMAEQWGGGI